MHQDAQVRGDAARQRAEVVAAFEARHDAAAGVLVGERLDLLGDPGVVGLDQAELAELVVAVRVEAGRDEDHLRREAVEAVIQFSSISARTSGPRVYGGTGTLIMLSPSGTAPLYGIERMLEDARHQDALVAGDDVLGAVAVVDVEVDDRDALEAAHVERVARGDGDVVEEAEAHRLVARRVMAGRAHRAERVGDVAVDDRVGGGDGGAGGAQHRVQGAGRSDRVGVERAAAGRRRRRARARRAARRRSRCCGRCRGRLLSTSGASRQSSAPCSPEAIRWSSIASSRAGHSGWPRAHVVAAAVGMGVKGRGHRSLSARFF